MKSQENQQIKTGGIISLFALLGACVLAATPVWNWGPRGDSEKTLRRAEGLAYQIMEIQKSAKKGRIPASVGELSADQTQGRMGSDSWGQPFHFRLVKVEGKTKVLVWSAGPNQTSETNIEDSDSIRDNWSPDFQGDDLGIIVSYK